MNENTKEQLSVQTEVYVIAQVDAQSIVETMTDRQSKIMSIHSNRTVVIWKDCR